MNSVGRVIPEPRTPTIAAGGEGTISYVEAAAGIVSAHISAGDVRINMVPIRAAEVSDGATYYWIRSAADRSIA
jgi:hypothetical protein